MSSAQIRQKLHDYVDQGDEKFLKVVYALAKEYLEGGKAQYEMSEEQLQVLNERRERYLSGAGKTYTLEETLKRAQTKGRKK